MAISQARIETDKKVPEQGMQCKSKSLLVNYTRQRHPGTTGKQPTRDIEGFSYRPMRLAAACPGPNTQMNSKTKRVVQIGIASTSGQLSFPPHKGPARNKALSQPPHSETIMTAHGAPTEHNRLNNCSLCGCVIWRCHSLNESRTDTHTPIWSLILQCIFLT